jgi:nucleoid-associated protein YgaU
MNRYNALVPSEGTRKYYLTALPTTIPEEAVPFYYTAAAGDRLDMLAHRFYKTPTKWWVIAKANNLANGSLAIPAGMSLLIPNI